MDLQTFEYGSAHAYAEAVRKWISDTQSWYAFHHMIAAQMAATVANPSVHTTQIRLPQHSTVTLTVGGQRIVTARYQIPSFGRRIVAELIDCIFAFAIKLILVYMLIEADVIDLARYERLMSDQADLQVLIDLTHELFPLEVVGKVICSIIEALLISYGLGALPNGMTPGKSIMGLRVISCQSVASVVDDRRAATVTGSERVPFFSSLLRALFKNVLVNSLLPLSSIVFVFSHNRALYDMTANTIVVRYPH